MVGWPCQGGGLPPPQTPWDRWLMDRLNRKDTRAQPSNTNMLATSPRGPPSWSLQVLLNVSLVYGLMIECMVLVARDVQEAGPPFFASAGPDGGKRWNPLDLEAA